MDRGLSMITRTLHLTAPLASLLLGGLLISGLAGCGPSYPKCDTDDDCHEAEYCVNGQCQQCRADSNCPGGQACTQGRCDPIEGYCTQVSDCGPGFDCTGNRCVSQPVASEPEPQPAAVADGPCQLEPVYFGYDSSTLEGAARDQLARVARCIREQNLSAVHLTGLTDPSGTEEYNLALGDRRAGSAASYLKSLGVEARITHSSLGEEMASGEDEAGWARDRRVDVKPR